MEHTLTTFIALALYVMPDLSADIQHSWRLVFRPLDGAVAATFSTN